MYSQAVYFSCSLIATSVIMKAFPSNRTYKHTMPKTCSSLKQNGSISYTILFEWAKNTGLTQQNKCQYFFSSASEQMQLWNMVQLQLDTNSYSKHIHNSNHSGAHSEWYRVHKMYANDQTNDTKHHRIAIEQC